MTPKDCPELRDAKIMSAPDEALTIKERVHRAALEGIKAMDRLDPLPTRETATEAIARIAKGMGSE